MKTTRKQALKIFNIVKWIDTFSICDLDKEDFIQSLIETDFAESIDDLEKFICEGYETIDLLHDTELLRRYLNLVKEGA